MHKLRPPRAQLVSLLVPVIGALSGCGGGEFDVAPTALRLPARKLEPGPALAKPLRIPTDEPFLIHEPSSEQKGGGVVECSADPAGKAVCRARCRAAGMASGQFQLGHKIENTSAADLSLSIRVDVKGRVTRDQTGDDSDTSSMADLTVFVKDTRGALAAKHALAGGDGGPSQSEFHRVTQFDATLPGRCAAYIVLSGRASASASAATQASAELILDAAAIEVAPGRPPAASAPASRP